jgi:nucleotide-binding universal stress UspA family protein
MFHNLLVCVDGSCHSQRALAEAIDIATAGNGRITLLTAIPRPPYWVTSPATAAAVEPLGADLAREARTTLAAAIDRIPDSIPVTSVLSEKPIREAIMDRLAEGHHDLLVMGSRGRGALSAQLLGSVSHYALNHAAVPVLIVHTDQDVSDAEALPVLAATA